MQFQSIDYSANIKLIIFCWNIDFSRVSLLEIGEVGCLTLFCETVLSARTEGSSGWRRGAWSGER